MVILNRKQKTTRVNPSNKMDKTQKGGYSWTNKITPGSPEYETIKQALDVLSSVKNKTVYKLFLAWANEKGVGFFEKVSDARSKLERLEKYIDEVNKKTRKDDNDIMKLEMLNMKRKFLIRIILCMAYVYCKKSNLEETHINAFADDIKKLLDASTTATMSKRERNDKIIDSIKRNLLHDVPATNLTNYKMVIINLYQKLLNIGLEKTKFEAASAEAQKKILEEQKQQEARLATAKAGLPTTNVNITFQLKLDDIQKLYRKIITDFNTSNSELTDLYGTSGINYDRNTAISNTNPKSKPTPEQINTLFEIIKRLSATLTDCNQLIAKVNDANTSASPNKEKFEKFENVLKSMGFTDLTALTNYISDGTKGLIKKINDELTTANQLTRPNIAGGYRTKKHSPSAKKHSSRKHKNNQKHKNNYKAKTRINTHKRTRKH